MNCRYCMLIQWSDADHAFIVSLPEFGRFAKTHGETYGEAVKNGQEALELLIESCQEENRPLPKPLQFGTPIPMP